MPYKDPEKQRSCNIEVKRRTRKKQRLEKYGTTELQRDDKGRFFSKAAGRLMDNRTWDQVPEVLG